MPFAESGLATLEAFTAAFAGTDYALADLRFYHEQVDNWRTRKRRAAPAAATGKPPPPNSSSTMRTITASNSPQAPSPHQPGATDPGTLGLLATGYRPSTMRELASTPNPEARELLAEMSHRPHQGPGRRRPQALPAPPPASAKRVVVKLLVVVLRAFVDSLRVPDKPDAADIIELADTLAHTYTHDSLKDIILALKEARTSGTKFYQSLDVSTLYRLHRRVLRPQSPATSNTATSTRKPPAPAPKPQDVQLLGDAAPRLLEHVAQQIPADHPNAEALRHKLTITKAREARGLITPEQAEQQRAEARQATQRKAPPRLAAHARGPGANRPAPPPGKPGPAATLPHPPTRNRRMALAKKHDQLPLDLGQLYAADITGAILAFLTHHGYTVWRQNTTGIYDAAKARWRVNPQCRRGVPDIIGFRNAATASSSASKSKPAATSSATTSAPSSMSCEPPTAWPSSPTTSPSSSSHSKAGPSPRQPPPPAQPPTPACPPPPCLRFPASAHTSAAKAAAAPTSGSSTTFVPTTR